MKSLSYFNNNYKAAQNTSSSSVSNGNEDGGNQLLKVAEFLVDVQPEGEEKIENNVSIVTAKDSVEKKNWFLMIVDDVDNKITEYQPSD